MDTRLSADHRPPSRKSRDGEKPAWGGLPNFRHRHCSVGVFTLTGNRGLHGYNVTEPDSREPHACLAMSALSWVSGASPRSTHKPCRCTEGAAEFRPTEAARISVGRERCRWGGATTQGGAQQVPTEARPLRGHLLSLMSGSQDPPRPLPVSRVPGAGPGGQHLSWGRSAVASQPEGSFTSVLCWGPRPHR